MRRGRGKRGQGEPTAGQSSCQPASSVGQSSCSKLAAAGHTNSDPAAAAPQLLTASEQLRTEPLVLVLDTVMADLVESTAVLTHVDSEGRANMVDVGHKGDTKRVAVASGTIFLGKQQHRCF